MTRISKKSRSQRAFSLVEMLVVIAIIGILTQVSIAAVKGVFDRADREAAKANARMIVSHGNAALASGESVHATATNLKKAVKAVLAGVALNNLGDGSGSLSLTELTKEEKRYARKFMRFRDGRLRFVQAGKGAFEEQQDEAQPE